MKYSAYLATGQMIALMQSFSKIKVIIHGQESIPSGSIIFVVNHFTRIETLLLPYHIYSHTRVPVWSLADHSFFEGPLSGFLEKVGAVSTRNPDRDKLIVKSLLTGEANWIIFPEGRMVKDKEAISKPTFFGLQGGKMRPAHTGAATLALRTEFYRKRLNSLLTENPAEAERLMNLFQIDNMIPILTETTWIVPVNLTYYPLRARENVLSSLAGLFTSSLSGRLYEELLTEGTMFFDGVDIDIRFGTAIPVEDFLAPPQIKRDMFSLQPFDFDDRLPSLESMRQEATNLMRRFMADIYRMTTVNHDHLFASLLKALPFNEISETDFRRRVFLLSAAVPDKAQVFCHQSLNVGQIALLSDDRYHKYRDFLALAQETGVVRVKKGVLQRNPSNIQNETEFHRIRIENPLGVVANEVRPLSNLQKHVRWMAWLPEMLVRHRISDRLLVMAEKQFEDDYAMFSRSGSKARDIGAPLLLKGSSRRLGVVLVHGFLAAPREMIELAEYLHRRGMWVYCVRLRGHGTAPEDLALRRSLDWIESIDLGYALMSAICKRVVVGGFSFGGGLALDCAARVEGISGVFAISPPFQLQDRAARLAPALTNWNRFMDALHLHGAAKEYVDITTERPQVNYDQVPVAALAEMEKFMKVLEQHVYKVRVPSLVIQATNDPVVNAEGTAMAFNRISAHQKLYLPMNFDRHGILAGEGAENVHAAVADFIDSIRRGD